MAYDIRSDLRGFFGREPTSEEVYRSDCLALETLVACGAAAGAELGVRPQLGDAHKIMQSIAANDHPDSLEQFIRRVVVKRMQDVFSHASTESILQQAAGPDHQRSQNPLHSELLNRRAELLPCIFQTTHRMMDIQERLMHDTSTDREQDTEDFNYYNLVMRQLEVFTLVTFRHRSINIQPAPQDFRRARPLSEANAQNFTANTPSGERVNISLTFDVNERTPSGIDGVENALGSFQLSVTPDNGQNEAASDGSESIGNSVTDFDLDIAYLINAGLI